MILKYSFPFSNSQKSGNTLGGVCSNSLKILISVGKNTSRNDVSPQYKQPMDHKVLKPAKPTLM